MEKKQIIIVAVIVALVGTASLYVYSASQDAEEISISEIGQEDVGALVETSGTISQVDKLSGMYQIVLKDEGETASLDTYVDENVIKAVDQKEEVRPGAKLWVKGRVESYQDDINLKVSGVGDLQIKGRAYTSFTPIDSLLQNPKWYEGMNVKVRGEVESVEGWENITYFEICPLEEGNDTGYCSLANKVYQYDHTENNTLIRGRPVVYKGEFKYDQVTGRWMVIGSEPPE